jgi:hypothetical protein
MSSKTRLDKTSFKGCTERLNLLKSLKVVAMNWCATNFHHKNWLKGTRSEKNL